MKGNLLEIGYKQGRFGANTYRILWDEPTLQSVSTHTPPSVGDLRFPESDLRSPAARPTLPSPSTYATGRDDRKTVYTEKIETDYFEWLLSKFDGLNLTGKEKTAVEKVVASRAFDLSVLKLATSRVLDSLDVTNSFDHAGDKLATNLEFQCKAVKAAREKERRTQALLEESTRIEQARARQEREAMEVARQAEAELEEDELGDPGLVVRETDKQESDGDFSELDAIPELNLDNVPELDTVGGTVL